jgi:hypothetical protein
VNKVRFGKRHSFELRAIIEPSRLRSARMPASDDTEEHEPASGGSG